MIGFLRRIAGNSGKSCSSVFFPLVAIVASILGRGLLLVLLSFMVGHFLYLLLKLIDGVTPLARLVVDAVIVLCSDTLYHFC